MPAEYILISGFGKGDYELGRKLTTIFKVLIAAYLISAVLLAVGAFIMYKMRLGDGQMRIVVMVIYGISSIAAGIIYGKAKKEKRVLNGALIGLLYFVFLSVVSFIINKGLYDDVKKAIISFVICITGGILGAIMS